VSGVHVRVEVGGEQYALPVEHVREVVEAGELTPVPGTADNVIGLHNLAGEIVPALDLAAMVGATAGKGARRLIVVERAGRPLALAVDQVLDVGSLGEGMEEHESPYLLASTIQDEAMVGVLDLEALLADVPGEGGDGHQ
jgi:purine-binding chemotaxis protein CheW